MPCVSMSVFCTACLSSVRLFVLPDTSLTNFFAFILGSNSSLPAVEYFCLYASTAILFDFFLQVRENPLYST